jgi:hypothetical protein
MSLSLGKETFVFFLALKPFVGRILDDSLGYKGIPRPGN